MPSHPRRLPLKEKYRKELNVDLTLTRTTWNWNGENTEDAVILPLKGRHCDISLPVQVYVYAFVCLSCLFIPFLVVTLLPVTRLGWNLARWFCMCDTGMILCSIIGHPKVKIKTVGWVFVWGGRGWGVEWLESHQWHECFTNISCCFTRLQMSDETWCHYIALLKLI